MSSVRKGLKKYDRGKEKKEKEREKENVFNVNLVEKKKNVPIKTKKKVRSVVKTR